jgi:hypothetical protein
MQPARYALLSGRTLDDVAHDLTRGALESVRIDGGQLLVAPAAVQALGARLARERGINVPPEISANSTRPPMLPQDYARLAGCKVEDVSADLARGALASARIDGGMLMVAGSAVDELLYRQAQARAEEA